MLLLQGDPEAALGVAQSFVREHPTLAEAYFQRAQVLISLGRADEARQDLQQVLELQDRGPLAEEARRRLTGLGEWASLDR